MTHNTSDAIKERSFADAQDVLHQAASEEGVKGALLASLELFAPCGTYAVDLRLALESGWREVGDCLVARSPKRMGAAFLITRDTAMMQKSPLSALTAGEFLDHMEAEHGLTYEDIYL